MTTPLIVDGVTYDYPTTGDTGWGDQATLWAAAVTATLLPKAGGSYPLTGQIDFGSVAGFKLINISSQATNPATVGVLRMGEGEVIAWRNAGNTGNNFLGVNLLNQLTLNNVPVGMGSGTVTSVAATSSTLDVTGSPITTAGTINVELPTTGVTAGAYTSLNATIDAYGRITAAASGAGGGVSSFNTRIGAVTLTSGDVTTALGYTPLANAVTSFNTRTGAVTLTSSDVTTALGFTPGTGNGTVTSVAASGANGILVSGSPVTSTGTLALSLGAITPTSINTAGSITATGAVTGSNLSGSNTGDQTITLTGGVTGSGTGSFAATVVTNANLTGMVTSVGNATTVVTNANLSGDVTSVGNVTTLGTVPIAKGGTGQTTAALAINALLPSQSGQAGKVLGTNGAVASWVAGGSGGTPAGSDTWIQVNASGVFGAYPGFTYTDASNTLLLNGTVPIIQLGTPGWSNHTIERLPVSGGSDGTLSIAAWPAYTGASQQGGNIQLTAGIDQAFKYGGGTIALAGGTGSFAAGGATFAGGDYNSGAGLFNQGGFLSGGGATASTGGNFSLNGGTYDQSGTPAYGATITLSGGSSGVGGDFVVKTNNTNRLIINSLGDWAVAGTAGTAGQVLTSSGAGVPPTWAAAAAGGTVTSVAFTSSTLTATGGPITSSGTLNVELPTTAVTAGSYTNGNFTVDAYGRLTAASNGSAGGVTSFNTRTGAVTLTSGDVTTALGFTPGTGTVTSVSVVTANGVSGSVATSTTTPAITLTLGAITPSSIAATGTVTGSNLSGTNTGDQTITLTGNVTGSGTGSFAATIAANAVTNAKLAQMVAHTYKGNNTGSTANAADITSTQLTADLNLFSSTLQGLVPASGGGTTNFLRADGTWAAAGAGTVTAVSIATANGFAGSSSGGTTPALTLTTSVTGVLKGNGTAISAATAGTDYSAGTSALSTGILKSTTTTGALTIAIAADFPTLNQNTTGSAATLTTARTINGTSFDGSADITITAAAGTLTGTTLNSTVVTSSLTSVGTIGTGVWQGTKVAEAYGGTNQSTYATGDILYASASNTLSKLAVGSTGQVLTVAAGVPSWAATSGGASLDLVSYTFAGGL